MKRETLWLVLGVLALLALGTGTAVVVYKMTRGLRNNNPGNIRHSSAAWQGMSVTQSDPAFVTFDDPAHGIRAMAVILKKYLARGVNTISEIIGTWAPPIENNTAAYIAAVANQTGIGAGSLIREQDLPALITAIIQHENNAQPYAADVIAHGVSLA